MAPMQFRHTLPPAPTLRKERRRVGDSLDTASAPPAWPGRGCQARRSYASGKGQPPPTALRPARPLLLAALRLELKPALDVAYSDVAWGRWIVLRFRRLAARAGFGMQGVCGTTRRPIPQPGHSAGRDGVGRFAALGARCVVIMPGDLPMRRFWRGFDRLDYGETQARLRLSHAVHGRFVDAEHATCWGAILP